MFGKLYFDVRLCGCGRFGQYMSTLFVCPRDCFISGRQGCFQSRTISRFQQWYHPAVFDGYWGQLSSGDGFSVCYQLWRFSVINARFGYCTRRFDDSSITAANFIYCSAAIDISNGDLDRWTTSFELRSSRSLSGWLIE